MCHTGAAAEPHAQSRRRSWPTRRRAMSICFSRVTRTVGTAVALAILVHGGARARAQSVDLSVLVYPAAADSGVIANRSDRPATVFTQDVTIPRAPWLRLV